MNNNATNIGKLFYGLQKQMLAQLNVNREFIPHSTSKGDSLEDVWIQWLRNYLPNRYCVDKAIIIDSVGNFSEQIDLVIYDQHFTPFIFTQNGIHFIPAEGVYAVFEVKPDLKGNVKVKNKSYSYIQYAGKKIESVRKLKRTSTNIIDVGDTRPPRPLTKIVGGILTSDNTIAKISTVKAQLGALRELQTIDIGCVANFGSFYIDYKGDYSPPRKPDTTFDEFNDYIHSYYKERDLNHIEISKRSASLITFFLQLMRYLQQSIGTVAAIDLNAYAKFVDFEIDPEP